MTVPRLLRFAACVALAALGFITPTFAGTGTGTFQVSATVVSACTISAATLNFGSAINPTSATVPLSASTTMTVFCSSTTPYTVALSAGTNAGGAANFSARTMKNGSNSLLYQLYMDTMHTTIWGDGTSGSALSPGVGIGSNQTLTIYGLLPSLTGAVPGTYTDTVTVTVSY